LPLLTDTYGRTFKTLRVSLTSTCNLGCVYCVEESGNGGLPVSATTNAGPPLTVAGFAEIISALHHELDLETVRLTGGEPTLYRDLPALIREIRNIGIASIKMTTNGYLLTNKIDAYAEAGLTSLNISLDAVEPEPFFRVSRRRNLRKILDGIEKAVALGLEVKINCVVMRGLNDDQIVPLFDYARSRGIRIRYLELMQMGHLHGNFADFFVSESEIVATLAQHTPCQPLPRDPSATAKYWQLPDGYRFGVISNESDPFCNDCNRLRLDSHGNLYGCLSDNTPIAVTDALHQPDLLRERLQQALLQKKTRFSGSTLSMLEIGG
jgi:cyclic pyranopterin phosphate synthase